MRELKNYEVLISGVVTVSVVGRTQPEKRYILETVLDHLPEIRASFGGYMKTHIIEKNGITDRSYQNEFGQNIDKSYSTQDSYMIVIEGKYRDALYTINEVHRGFQKWICRLAKRLYVEDTLVKLTQCCDKWIKKEKIITNANNQYQNMFEEYSWVDSRSMNWTEYLLWDRTEFPHMPNGVKEYYQHGNESHECTHHWHKLIEESHPHAVTPYIKKVYQCLKCRNMKQIKISLKDGRIIK